MTVREAMATIAAARGGDCGSDGGYGSSSCNGSDGGEGSECSKGKS